MPTTHHKRPTSNPHHNNHRRLRWFHLAAIASILPAFTSAQADNWTDGTGNWNTPTNWNSGIPGSDSRDANVNIVNSDGNSRTINYDYTGPAVTLNALNLSLTGGSSGSSDNVSMSANSLAASYEFIAGYSGSGFGGTLTQSTGGVGTFNQSGGTNTIGHGGNIGQLNLGYTTGSIGTYNLSGTGSLSAGNEQIGGLGDGIFNQTGGTNSVGGSFNFGLYLQSQSTYTLSGSGTLSVVGVEQISVVGIGGFFQTGGTSTTNGSSDDYDLPGLSINGLLGYQLSGNGTLNAIELPNEPAELIGSGTLGNFFQFGGTNNITNPGGTIYTYGSGLYLGVGGVYGVSPSGSGTGNYYLYGGLLSVSTNEFIGAVAPGEDSNQSGDGTFVQTGGTNTTANLYLGYKTGAGYYYLSGGALSATATEQIGAGGTATFVQTGGSNTTPSLYVAATGYGNYQLQGGSLVVAGNEYIASTGVDQPTMGQFFQTGGANNITAGGNLNIGQGAYTLSAGALTIAGQMNVGYYSSGALFTQTGGVLSVAGPIVVNSENTFSISGGSTTAGSLLEQGIVSIAIHDLTDFGQLHILGAITLSNSTSSALNLQFDPTYAPQYGDTFPIIVGEGGGTVTGQFASITSNLPPSDGSFQIEYQPPDNPYGIDVVFVPEPTCAAALLFLSTAALFHRPRKRSSALT